MRSYYDEFSYCQNRSQNRTILFLLNLHHFYKTNTANDPCRYCTFNVLYFLMNVPVDTINIVLAGFTLISLIWVARLEFRLHRLLRGKKAKNLEATILDIHKGWEESVHFRKDMEKYLTTVEQRFKKDIRAVEVKRYNAFKGNGEGGVQSFAVVFANESGDGVVLSSLFARDRTSVFAKAISKWRSDTSLSPEEQEAVSKAKMQLSK